MARVATGVDVGRTGARALRGRVEGNGFVVTGFASAPNPDGSIAAGWSALGARLRPRAARVGLTGRDVNVRYTRVPRVADWQLRKLMRFEAEEVGARSEAPIASDFNVLAEIPEIEGEDVVLLAMARESLLEQHLVGLSHVGGRLDAFTPNAIALYNAFLRFGAVLDDTVLIANVGAASTDVVVVRGADLLFARNLLGGSELFDEALAERFDVSPERAARYKETQATLLAPSAPGGGPGGGFADANQEKAYRAMLAPAGQLASLLRSAVVFCKSQVKVHSLELDRVLLCGGGARLDGLPEHLSTSLGVPVERFDPFVVVDDSRLAPDEREALEARRYESVVALGLATMGSDAEAYSIEILPERVQRRRAALERGSFLVASALVALAFLGFRAWSLHGRADALRLEAARAESRLQGARRHDDETRALQEQNEALARRAGDLHAIAATGETLVRTLAAVERHLPAGFWLEGLSSTYAREEAAGLARGDERPVLRLRGRAREGTQETTELFQGFVAGLRAELEGFAVEERLGDTAAFFTLAVSPYGQEGGPDGEDSGTAAATPRAER